jgi:hypothetical protein
MKGMNDVYRFLDMQFLAEAVAYAAFREDSGDCSPLFHFDERIP